MFLNLSLSLHLNLINMRLLYIFFFITFFSFSQTNEVLINQAVQTAESQNITTQSQAVKALENAGMSENQARQLARQRGVSYDKLMNEYFNNDSTSENTGESDMDTSILEKASDDNVEESDDIDNLEDEESDDVANKIKGGTRKYFGYNIFRNNPYLNKEYLLGNIDEGYLISPGDEIRIITYGDNSLEVKVTVDRNGNINIQNYGLFFASGMSFKTLKSRLKIYLGRYLSGLVSSPQKTFMDVALTELKPTKVVVLGQVVSPGPHILTTSGSALSALYAAGGVKYSGSLREIIIYRNNKLYKKIDLYDYITTGELRDDVRLTNNDVVFVPNRKNAIEIKGELRSSAIYEVLDDEDLTTLVEYSGGILPTTQTNKVNIQRIVPAEERTEDNIIDRKLITIDYQKLINDNKKIILVDGDQVIFYRILDLESDQVSISGHVFESGTYSLQAFSTLKSLIFDAAKGIMPDVYLEKVDVFSLLEGIEVLNTYDLSEVILGNSPVNLLDGDRVIIYSNTSVEGNKTISLYGYGVETKTIKWRENYSIYDLIFSSTQIKSPEFIKNILKTRIDLKRYNEETGNFYTVNYDFKNPENLKEIILLPKDKVILYNTNVSEKTQNSVSIYGNIRNSIETTMEDNMYPEDVILLAGGYLESANQDYVDVSRYEINPNEERITRLYRVEIDKDYLLGNSNEPKEGFKLENKDIILVPIILGYEDSKRVTIKGEVNFPKSVILEFKTISFKNLIERVGGLTKYANLKASYLLRDNLVINLDLSKIDDNDLIFENEDEVYIESLKGIVQTVGALQNPSNFIWKKGPRAKAYIRNSGGKNNKESAKSYITLPNGITKKINFFSNPRVEVNSIITVNRKIEKEKKERRPFIDGFNSTFGIIASALTTILLASKL